ncbi:hypothetical protein FQN51_007107 [Onygenales sp. PD_10]|nr:hypothetical protein FQN51_007107 [Onygenales sp. PD_10]
MGAGCSVDCSEYSWHIQDNPDISGTGVLVGFVGSCCIVVLILIWHYLFVFDPNLDPFRKHESDVTENFEPNIVDKRFLDLIRRLLPNAFKPLGTCFPWLRSVINAVQIWKRKFSQGRQLEVAFSKHPHPV